MLVLTKNIMEVMKMNEIFNWLGQNVDNLIAVYLSLVGAASIIVKLTPTLKDDHLLKKVVKFMGKVIALNRK